MTANETEIMDSAMTAESAPVRKFEEMDEVSLYRVFMGGKAGYSPEEILAAAQALENIAARKMGVEPIVISVTANDSVYGSTRSFVAPNGEVHSQIFMNHRFFESDISDSGFSLLKMMDTLFHETRHVYQRVKAEEAFKAFQSRKELTPDQREALKWYVDFVGYDNTNNPNTLVCYDWQPVELDARHAAGLMVKEAYIAVLKSGYKFLEEFEQNLEFLKSYRDEKRERLYYFMSNPKNVEAWQRVKSARWQRQKPRIEGRRQEMNALLDDYFKYIDFIMSDRKYDFSDGLDDIYGYKEAGPELREGRPYGKIGV